MYEVDRVLSAAQSWVGLTEQGGENKGIVPQLCLKDCGLSEGYPWCSAFVAHCGKAALFNVATGKTLWPCILNASCLAMSQWAEHKGILSSKPGRGKIFLLYEAPLKRVAHAGFILSDAADKDSKWGTIEGNTTLITGSREGYAVCNRKRVWGPKDVFIDWVSLISV